MIEQICPSKSLIALSKSHVTPTEERVKVKLGLDIWKVHLKIHSQVRSTTALSCDSIVLKFHLRTAGMMMWAFRNKTKPPSSSVTNVWQGPGTSPSYPAWKWCHLPCCPKLFQPIRNVLKKACIRMTESAIMHVSLSATSWCFCSQLRGCLECFVVKSSSLSFIWLFL